MSAFFYSGLATDVIFAVLGLEVVVLVLLRPARWLNTIIAVLPGVCLLLALRAALVGDGWEMIALWLGLSFPAHLADLWQRPP